MRKIVVYIAVSADGFIARPDGAVDWLDRPRPKGNHGMGDFLKTVDTMVMGRKTYEVGLTLGGGANLGAGCIVFSRSRSGTDAFGVQFVNEPVAAFVERLRGLPGKDIWLMGGGELIASFLDAGAIDEFIVYVIPTLIGEGIPLIAPRRGDIPLRLRSSRKFADGTVCLHYVVGPAAPRKRAPVATVRATKTTRGRRSAAPRTLRRKGSA